MNSLKIEKILNNIFIDQQIKDTALEIYNNKIPNILKVERKIKAINMTYLIVIEAYKTLGIPPDYQTIKKSIKLSKIQTKNILKIAARNGYEPVIHKYEPYDFIESCCHIVGIHKEHEEKITLLINKLLIKMPIFNEYKPQNIAASAVLYYSQIKGYDVNLFLYTKSCGVARSSLDIVKKKFIIVDNT